MFYVMITLIFQRYNAEKNTAFASEQTQNTLICSIYIQV